MQRLTASFDAACALIQTSIFGCGIERISVCSKRISLVGHQDHVMRPYCGTMSKTVFYFFLLIFLKLILTANHFNSINFK